MKIHGKGLGIAIGMLCLFQGVVLLVPKVSLGTHNRKLCFHNKALRNIRRKGSDG